MQRRSVRAQCPREPPAERLRHPDSRTRAIRCVAMCRQGARCGIAPGRPEFFTASLYRPPLRDAACPYREQRCCLSPDRPAVCHPNRAVFCCVPVSVACPFLFPEQPTSRACRTSTHAFPRWPRTRALTGPMPPCRAHGPVRCAPAGWRQPAVSPAVSGAQSLLIPCGSDGSCPGRTPGRGCFWPLSSARQVRVVMSVSSCPCRHFRAGFPGRSLLPATLSPSRSPSCCKRSRKSPCRSARSSSASRCRFV